MPFFVQRHAAPVLLLAFLALSVASPVAAHDSIGAQIATASRAIDAAPQAGELYLRRGELHRLAHDWQAAREDYAAAARCDPAPAELDLCWGALHLDAAEPQAALGALDRFLALWPDHADALELRSRALQALDRDAEAAAALDRCITVQRAPRPEHYLQRARLQRAANVPVDDIVRGLEAGVARLGPIVALEQYALEIESAAGRSAAAAARRARLELEREPVQAPPAPRPGEAIATPHTDRIAAAHVPLPRNSIWKYDASGIDRGTAWRSNPYDDSAWPSGPGVLGYGEPYIATPVPFGEPLNRYITTYFRTTFDLKDEPQSIQGLALAVNYDDGFVAYLNGQEVARRSLPAGEITYATLASSHEGGTYLTIDLQAFASLLVQGTNLLAVEVHQTAVTSSDLVFDLELSYGARLTRAPYLQIATASGVHIRWRTNVPLPSRILYGDAPTHLTKVVSDPAPVTEHDLVVDGVSARNRYFYAVASNDEIFAGGDAQHYFDTGPLPGERTTTRVWVLGDSGRSGLGQTRVRDAYVSFTGTTPTDVWLMLGDNAYDSGTDAEYQTGLFDPYADLLPHCALWPTRGNHDAVFAGPSNDYYDLFTLPTAGEAGGVPSGTEAYYSFDHANIHFVCLDSEGSDRSANGAMCTWLRADLTADHSDWRIAYWHHPPYTKGSHDSDNDFDSGGRMRDMRVNVLPILDSLGVDLVLTGHSHSYERSWLLDRHYGTSNTLSPKMILDHGDGRTEGDGEYRKPTYGSAGHEGTVHVVAGSGSQTSGGSLDHAAMYMSLDVLGSMVIDVDRNQMTARFLDDSRVVRDHFVIFKGEGVPTESSFVQLKLGPGEPNPTHSATEFAYSLPVRGEVRITLHDAGGRRVATLVDAIQEAGLHRATWDGRDDRHQPVASGVYFARLEFGTNARHGKIVLLR